MRHWIRMRSILCSEEKNWKISRRHLRNWYVTIPKTRYCTLNPVYTYKRDDVSTFDAISINCLHCQLHSNDYSTSIFTVECGRVCVFHFYFIRFDSILFDFVAVFSFIFLGVIRCCWCLISLTFTFTLALSVCLGLLKRRKSVKYCAF